MGILPPLWSALLHVALALHAAYGYSDPVSQPCTFCMWPGHYIGTRVHNKEKRVSNAEIVSESNMTILLYFDALICCIFANTITS